MATKTLSWIEKIKQKDGIAVDGYIRECNKTMFGNNNVASFYDDIPDVINILCLEYYHMTRDRFHPDLHTKFAKITQDSAKIDSAQSFGKDGSALLSNIVSSGIHHWRFKVCGYEVNDIIYIGVYKVNEEYIAEHQNANVAQHFTYAVYYHGYPEYQKTSYAVNFKSGQVRGDIEQQKKQEKYCDECQEGDIIDMYLDLHAYELKYSINDKDFGDAGFEIGRTQYRAGVCLYGKGAEVQLLLYENY